MIRYSKRELSRTQKEFIAEYHQVVKRLGYLPTEQELAEATCRTTSGVHRHLVNVREITGQALPTRGFDYWRTLWEQLQEVRAENHALAQRVTVAEGTLDLVADWARDHRQGATAASIEDLQDMVGAVEVDRG